MISAKHREIKIFICNELKRMFHVMSVPEITKFINGYKSVKYKGNRAWEMRSREPPPSDFNNQVINKFGTRQKASKAITKKIQREVEAKFGLKSEKIIEGTNFLIDLYDEDDSVSYEIALGDGSEFFKDVLKALLIGAEKLVVFCRSYPNPWGMTGYSYVKKQWEMMRNKIGINVEIIEFVSGKSYS